jgi:hypothetical protein
MSIPPLPPRDPPARISPPEFLPEEPPAIPVFPPDIPLPLTPPELDPTRCLFSTGTTPTWKPPTPPG